VASISTNPGFKRAYPSAMSIGIVAHATERCRKFTANGSHIDVRNGHVDTYHHG
jgi:hypothetical protein